MDFGSFEWLGKTYHLTQTPYLYTTNVYRAEVLNKRGTIFAAFWDASDCKGVRIQDHAPLNVVID